MEIIKNHDFIDELSRGNIITILSTFLDVHLSSICPTVILYTYNKNGIAASENELQWWFNVNEVYSMGATPQVMNENVINIFNATIKRTMS